LTCGFFVAAGYLITQAPGSDNGVAGWIMAGLAMPATLIGLYMLIRRPVMLRLDADGVHQYTIFAPGLSVRFEQIREARVVMYMTRKIVVLALNDNESYVQGLPKKKQRSANALIRTMGTPMVLYTYNYGSADKVAKKINEMAEASAPPRLI
jgi:hypothetical protein